MTGKLKYGKNAINSNSKIEELTFVEKHNDFVEWIHEVHVLVAILLNLQDQSKFRAIIGGESLEELLIILEMA